MGLASFNRMRLRRIEQMKPENITKEEEVKVQEPEIKEVTEEIKQETKEESVTRGSKRKK